MSVKHLLFQSKAEFHAGKQAQADRKYGLAVVRFDVKKKNSLLKKIRMILFSVQKIWLNNL